MSFIKDLMAWKSRPERDSELSDDDSRAETFDVDEAELGYDEDEEDWDEDEDYDDEDEDYDDEDEGVLDESAAAAPRGHTFVKPLEMEKRPAANEVEDILARVQSRAARAAAEAQPLQPKAVAPVAPPKIWEMNVGGNAPVAKRLAEAPRPAAAAPAAPATPAAPRPVAPVAPPVRARAEPPVTEPLDAKAAAPAAPAPVAAAAPVTPPQDPRPVGRVKTRLLGFHHPGAVAPDPFEAPAAGATQSSVRFPTGWIAVIAGPGRGASFALQSGVSQIGRGEDQAIRLDFGDLSISRNNHAAIAYDDEMGKFYLGHGGKLNLVRLNGKPVLSTEELKSEDQIRIGETTLKFVALCGNGFSWTDEQDRGADAAAG